MTTYAEKERVFADAAHHERRFLNAVKCIQREISKIGMRRAGQRVLYHMQRRDAMARKYERLSTKWYFDMQAREAKR